MKNLIALLTILLVTVSCVNGKKDNKPLKVSVEITGKNTKSINPERDTITTYPFKISIHNQTDSTFCFWLMTCSHGDNFKFNTKGIEFYSWGCNSNFPKLIELSSEKDYIIEGEFEITNLETIIQQKDLRMALILFKKNDDPTEINSHLTVFPPKRQKQKELIWCENPIKYDW